MYSLIMMTAMASTPAGPEFHGYFRDKLFGKGCAGTVAAATSCQGCAGCTCHGGLISGDRVKSWFSFNGSCNGCGGGCTGVAYSCGGCCGAIAYSCGGGMMPMGSPYATPMPTNFVMPGFDTVPMIPPTALPGVTPYAQPAPAEIRESSLKNQLPLPGNFASPNRATVIVKLPADARLFAEGKALSLTGNERTFVSPELPQSREYNYTFRVEYDRGGRMVGETRTVSVMPGKASTVEFADAGSKADAMPIPKTMPETKPVTTTNVVKADAGDRAFITVKLPAGSTLYVNDAKQSATEFRTPPLPAGKEFTYTLKIETTRNGAAEQVSQKTTFKAGENVTVDFTGGSNYRASMR